VSSTLTECTRGIMDKQMEKLAWRLSSNWRDNWTRHDSGLAVGCTYAVDATGQWWRREEVKRFLRGTEVTYHEIEGPVW